MQRSAGFNYTAFPLQVTSEWRCLFTAIAAVRKQISASSLHGSKNSIYALAMNEHVVIAGSVCFTKREHVDVLQEFACRQKTRYAFGIDERAKKS